MGGEEIRVADENPDRSWGYFVKAKSRRRRIIRRNDEAGG
jgi:hypothetical protein